MLRVTVMLILGMLVGKAAYPLVPTMLWLAMMAASIIVAFVLNKMPKGQTVAIFISFFFLGSYLMSDAVDKTKVSLPDRQISYEAVLLTEPTVHGKVVQTDLLIVGKGTTLKVRASILRDTVDNRWQRLHVGDGIAALSVLVEPRNFANSTFDYAGWLKKHGFKAETFIYYTDWKKAEVDLTKLHYSDRTIIQTRKLRQRFLAHYHNFGADGQSYAVLAAMALGDKSGLSKELKDDYSIAGASHVLALSGLHLGIIYGVLTFLTLGFRRRWMPQLFIMLAVWAYVVLVGMSASVVRSAIMLTVIALVTLLNRRNILLNSLGVAAFVLLLWNPMNLYDIGFEMSFMAVLGIALFEPFMMPRHEAKNKFEKYVVYWLWGIISVSIAAQIGTAPLVAYYFGRFSTYFLITNIIVIPLATVILYGFLLTAVVSFIPVLSSWLMKALFFLVMVLNSSLHWIASLPGACIDGINWSLPQVVGIYIFIFAVYLIINFLHSRR